ncbi:MAG: hypothetical protein K2Q01_01540 [Rickettsiales bacterium]|nr:hypothetical protein [Rickettsiales bacterium]
MVEALLMGIFLTAALSLASYVYCWQDIKTGRPHIITLRQITAIMDRNQLNALFGMPKPGYFYELSEETVHNLLTRYRGYYVRECAADSVCMLGVWRHMQGAAAPETMALFILLAMTCQGVNIIYSMHLIKKYRHQLREEMENPGD